MLDTLFRAPRVITAVGESARSVGIRDGRIVAIEPLEAQLEARQTVELGEDVVLMPGLVDTHVHINEPGRTEWEGFASATRAAAAGGVTTLIDMPLNSIPPTTTVEGLQAKRKAAEGAVYVDTGFWGGAVPGNLEDLRPLHDAGVFGFKCFLLHSGVDEFQPLSSAELEQYLAVLHDFGALMIVHAENSQAIDRAPAPEGDRYGHFLASRPRGAENMAVAEVIEAARYTRARTHILHLSSSDALPMLASAKRDGVPITAETCPHYLSFTSEAIPDGATQFKCCPPIRETANRELLWEGLREGVIDCVVTDHSPCTPELKRFDIGDFGVAWGGISSVQLGLRAVWSQARVHGFTLTDVVEWMAVRTAGLAGLTRKGRIALGHDADLVVFAPDEATVVSAGDLEHRHPITPYDGMALAGVVRETWLAGELLDLQAPPRGRLLRRGDV
ncbi:allantoinase [Kineosporia sp. NBRC 101677]|uniref:allantoinase AllB n=1 Tax=Kineosporia sp. NBRC 101677 TaxID=3032197 RepID=UPI0024A4064E|nr:allantoinase AllB [Kineosporia sp. NBRC 101677]GLY14322.1 allantoinase [Kineosporia sp. NBRC 101677]